MMANGATETRRLIIIIIIIIMNQTIRDNEKRTCMLIDDAVSGEM